MPGGVPSRIAARPGASAVPDRRDVAMTRLCITHRTRYRFHNPVDLAPHRMMLRPRETPDLRLLSFKLDIRPAALIDWSHDVAGNVVALASFQSRAQELEVLSQSRVDLRAPVWPVFPISASAASYPFVYSPDESTDLGALILPQYEDHRQRLRGWVGSIVATRPTDTLSLLKDVSNAITTQIAYQGRETEGTQGPLETLDRGWGTWP